MFVLFTAGLALSQECCDWPALPASAFHPEGGSGLSVGLSYGYTRSAGLQSGTRDVSLSSASQTYMHIPTEMTSYRIDAQAAYTFTPIYSASLSIPWMRHTMDMYSITETTHTETMTDHSQCGEPEVQGTKTVTTTERHTHQHSMDPVEGWGDLRLEGSVRLMNAGAIETGLHQAFFLPGLKTPTGSYRKKDGGVYVDPCMQPGTGSWDPTAALEYRFSLARFACSAAADYQVTTRNSLGYEYGDVAAFGVYPSYRPFDFLKVSTGLRYRHVDRSQDHEGAYTDLESVTADPANTGGDLVDGVLSLALMPVERLAMSVGVSLPIWDDLNGIQTKPGELYTVGAALRF